MILLAACLLCVLPQALAEAPTAQPTANNQINGGNTVAPTAPPGTPAVQDGETSAPDHNADHKTEERLHGVTQIEKTDSADTHRTISVYDLYCLDCGRVIKERVRTEESNEKHAWRTARIEPTCQEEGQQIQICSACGMEIREILPKISHQFVGAAQLMRREAGTIYGTGELSGKVIGEITAAPTCTESGSGSLLCVMCGKTWQPVSIPAIGHEWGEWEDVTVPESEICVTDVTVIRFCQACGEEESRQVSPAPGHQWKKEARIEPSCTEKGVSIQICAVCKADRTEEIPPLGHEYVDIELLIKHAAGDVVGTGKYHGLAVGMVIIPSTCVETGLGTLQCVRCWEVSQQVTIPAGDHNWGEWVKEEIPPEKICVTDVEETRQCQDCGETETQVVSPAPGHKWVPIRYQEPTCTEAGEAVRQCSVCHAEETFETPAIGHSYMWVDLSTPSPSSSGTREYRCTVCGDVAKRQKIAYAQMYYNNSITSFGPTIRELIGGSSWNRVTPLDLSKDGVYTYPLIASNMYTVGTATVIIDQGIQTVTYHLNSAKITVHSESLVLYPCLEALATGENAVSVNFEDPIILKDYFGDDTRVIMAITLRADYDAWAAGILSFNEDKVQKQALIDLLD